MCTVDNGGRLKFGASEWIKLASLMLTIAVVTSGAQFYVVRLLIANHSEQLDIHQSTLTKDSKFVSHSEFGIWVDGHIDTPHNGVLQTLSQHEARLLVIENQIKGR